MQFQCKEELKRLLNKPYINTVLEIGSGIYSTPLIFKYLTSGHITKFISLEDNPSWIDQIHNKIGFSPTYSKFGLIDGILKYDYKTNDKFDMVFIDGPGKVTGELVDTLYTICQSKDVCLSDHAAHGIQSIHLIEYIRPMIHDKSIILIDGRRAAVLFYLSKYPSFKFIFKGLRYGRQRITSILKPEYRYLSRYPLSEIVLMRKKHEKI